MLIGDLPYSSDPNKDDWVIFSKDGMHLLKIPYSEFVGSVGGGRGLKYWVETSEEFKRYMDMSSEFIDNDEFYVPGRAEITVQNVTEIPQFITEIIKRPGQPDEIRYNDSQIAYKGRYLFKRTSAKKVLGGLLYWKRWGTTQESRMSTNDDVRVGSSVNVKRWECLLPGWLLMSTHSEDLEYDFIFEDEEGRQELIEHVYPKTAGIEWNGLTFYVNGTPTASNYEPLFIVPRNAQSGPSYEYKGSLFSLFERPESSVKAGEWINTRSCTGPDDELYIRDNDTTGLMRHSWCNANVTSDFNYHGTYTVETYGKCKDLYVFTAQYDPTYWEFKFYRGLTVYDTEGHSVTSYTLDSYSAHWVMLNYTARIDVSSSTSDPNRRAELRAMYQAIDYVFNDPNNEWVGYKYPPEGYEPNKRAKTGTDLRLMDNVVNYSGIGYNEYPNKDAVHYIFYDGGIQKLGQYVTGLACGEGKPYILYAASNVTIEGDEPSEDDMQVMILADGTYRGTDFQVKQAGEWVSILDLIPTVEVGPIKLLKSYAYSKNPDTGAESYTRLTNLNIYTDRNLVHFVGKSNVTGGPPGDAIVVHLPWDNGTDALSAQLALAQGSNPRMWIRCQNASGTWTAWSMVPRYNYASISSENANKVLCTHTNGGMWVANTTRDEINYVHGVRSSIQDQIDANAPSIDILQTSGIHIADLTIGSTTYAIYAPNNGSGGLSSTIITGSTVPDDNVGSDGDLYFLEKSGKMFKYIKIEITARKGAGNHTQLSEIKLLDSSNNAYNFDGIIAKADKPLYRYDQKNENMFDGFTATKALWVATPTTSSPITITCTLFEPIDISVYNTLQLWTANDVEERDPQGWIISVSNDKTNWTVVNQETNYTMTSTRSALGYSNTLTLPANNTVITQRYFKESGHWIPILN